MEQNTTGAKREKNYEKGPSGHPIRLDLVLLCNSAIRRFAETLGEGAIKYGERNWQKGLQESSLICHLQDHMMKHIQGDKSEDHLGHAICNLAFLIWMQENKPEMMDLTGSSLDGTSEIAEGLKNLKDIVGAGLQPPRPNSAPNEDELVRPHGAPDFEPPDHICTCPKHLGKILKKLGDCPVHAKL